MRHTPATLRGLRAWVSDFPGSTQYTIVTGGDKDALETLGLSSDLFVVALNVLSASATTSTQRRAHSCEEGKVRVEAVLVNLGGQLRRRGNLNIGHLRQVLDALDGVPIGLAVRV